MTAPFTIGILETGRPPETLAERYASYPAMFADLLGAEAPADWCFRSFAALDGDLPENTRVCDAWLVTGSKYGAYEDFAWIHALRAFLKSAYEDGVPVVGICFGHQLLAEALGGKVEKSDKGWGCGTHAYEWTAKPDWMRGENDVFALQAYHQDQVIKLPEDAEILASSPFCDHAVLSYRNKAISFQAHPEFAADYAGALYRERRGDSLPVDVADAAIGSLEKPLDRSAIARGIVAFLKSFQARAD